MTFPSDLCHIRDHHECACPADTCRQQPKTPAPVPMASIKDMLATSIVIGAIAGFIAFVSIPRAAEVYHKQFLSEQESHNG